MIDAHRLVFNNISSEEFDVTPHLSFDNENGASDSFLNREAISTEIYDGSRRFIHGSKYTDSATPRFTLIKKNFGDFTPEENRRILAWLTSNSKPSWLEVYQDDSNALSYRYFCVPTTVEQYKLSNGRVVGYEFEIFSDAPYAWSRQFIYPEVYATTEEISNNDETNDYLTISGTESFKITCNTDEYNKPIYPKVTVTFKGKNPYFPIDVNPLEENTYLMVPNVIYSWVEKYRRATDYKEGTTYYSDKNGTEANPQPINSTQITDGEYYIFVNQIHYFVNLNGTKHNGRYVIHPPVDSDPVAGENTTDYKYYYFPKDNAIKTTVATKVNDIVSYKWETVALIGMAVRIKNTYILDGVSTTKEAIIAGGTMDEVVVLDGTNKIVSGTKGTAARIIGDAFNWEWIPFVYGENNITVSGNCTVKFEWLEPRKVGSL
jgi:hypothetical protein